MNDNLQELKSFLNKLFQFESQDLDFGIYKILHYKRKEVSNFINKLLVDTVKQQLQTFTADELRTAKEKLEELKQDADLQRWLKAVEINDETRLKIYEEDYAAKIKEYKNVAKQIGAAELADNTEDLIYNHLTRFFSRYYDKGDFISKRRYGKSEKYVVPYNGEETYFYWANHDQYYIKSSEYFQHFAFKVSSLNGTLTVNFKLTDAQTEQGNVKAEESRYFILSDDKTIDFFQDELVLDVYFEYRSLTEAEKKTFTGNGKQDILNQQAAEKLKQQLSNETAAAELWKQDENGETVLLKKLNHYTRKNSYDFFIHKNLKAFLQRELDFYIKTELARVEDLYVLESEQHFENIRYNFKLIKCFKNIADTIIDFLAQIEDFQKKLWEKKKFVLKTEWIVTIDKLAQWLDETSLKTIVEEVLQNETQKEEWKKLFGWNELPFAATVEGLKDEDAWRKLPIDTKHFSAAFKETLLHVLSEKINLEEEANGLVIHSDNYHGLQLLQEKFHEQVKCIHIDPPYNTKTSGFLYKNVFQHSSWLAMMLNRLEIASKFLSDSSCIQTHIDDNEYENLHKLFNELPTSNQGTIIWDKRNPVSGASKIATQHEYIVCHSKGDVKLKNRKSNGKEILTKAENLIKKNGSVNDTVRKEFKTWLKKQNNFSNGEKAYSEIDDKGKVYQSVHLGAPEQRRDPKFFVPLIHPITKKPCPVPKSGWGGTPEFLQDLVQKNEIIFGKDETVQPRRKYFLENYLTGEFTSMIYSGEKGKTSTDALGIEFPYCHPVGLYEDLIWAVMHNKNGWILDYFAGSGTSYHATLNLNDQDRGSRKCILIEQGNYVYTVILPRIKKIAYSFDWKEGKPQNMNGLGVFIKYQRLEQYEEALENIAFSASEKTIQQAIQYDQYIPKYFLEFETRGSNTLVNISAMQNPWNYNLKVWDGFTYDTEQPVDLIETFNYLIGLHVQKYFTFSNNEKKYVFVWGWNNEQKKSLVIWRDTTNWKIEDYDKDKQFIESKLPEFEKNYLYINAQSVVPGALMIEDVFKTKMMEE